MLNIQQSHSSILSRLCNRLEPSYVLVYVPAACTWRSKAALINVTGKAL